MSVTLGILLCAAGGLAGATFALPFRKVKGWSYESYWLIYAIFGLVLLPLALALATVPGLFGVIKATPTSVILTCAGFGALWGVGGLTWGLMIRYLGVGLGLAIGCGLCSATGTLLPPVFKGEAASLLFDANGLLVMQKLITLIGVALSLIGIVFVGLAGKSKENELPEEEKKKAVAEFDFKKGIVVALVSGVFSGGMGFGLSSGPEMTELAAKSGAGAWWTGMPVLVVVLWGGFVVNAAYCLVMMAKAGKSAAVCGRSPFFGMLVFSALAGIIWAMQFALMKIGEPLCGDRAYIGFAIVMGASVFFSSFLGILLGEWRGTGAKTRGYLAIGLALLALSIVLPVVAR